MTSNLAVIEAEIINVLPYQERTPANLAWVRENLANRDNTPSDVLAACKEFFSVTDARISLCESRLNDLGVQLNSHILDTAKNFEAVREELRELRTEVRINKAVAEANQSNQLAINNAVNNGIIGANQNATHAAGSKGWGWHPDPTGMFFLVLFMGLIGVMVISSTNNRPAPAQSTQERPVMRGY